MSFVLSQCWSNRHTFDVCMVPRRLGDGSADTVLRLVGEVLQARVAANDQVPVRGLAFDGGLGNSKVNKLLLGLVQHPSISPSDWRLLVVRATSSVSQRNSILCRVPRCAHYSAIVELWEAFKGWNVSMQQFRDPSKEDKGRHMQRLWSHRRGADWEWMQLYPFSPQFNQQCSKSKGGWSATWLGSPHSNSEATGWLGAWANRISCSCATSVDFSRRP